jgi:HSP20 family protein
MPAPSNETLPERWGRWLFERPFLRVPDLLWERGGGEVLAIDEYVADGAIVVRAELPGLDPDKDVEVEVADDTLRISAERGRDDAEAGREVLHRELRRGSVRRVLPLPAGTAPSDVTASYRDGILEVRVPMAVERTGDAVKVVVDRD